MKPPELQARGKLSQRCPCGVVEAAGSYSTCCNRPMGPEDWAVDARHARPERLLAPPSGPEALPDGSQDPHVAQNGPRVAAWRTIHAFAGRVPSNIQPSG